MITLQMMQFTAVVLMLLTAKLLLQRRGQLSLADRWTGPAVLGGNCRIGGGCKGRRPAAVEQFAKTAKC